jgi:hypothetical protein
MSSVNAPFGLRPAKHPSGVIRQESGTIASAYAANIFTGQPVKVGTDGTIQAAAVGDFFVGSFQGCEYTPANGRRVVSNFWPANTVATEIVAYFTSDPEIVYEIQADGSIDRSEVGQQADFTNIAASNGLGMSTATMNATTSAATAGQLAVVGFGAEITNLPGDAFTIVQVKIAEHQYAAAFPAF